MGIMIAALEGYRFNQVSPTDLQEAGTWERLRGRCRFETTWMTCFGGWKVVMTPNYWCIWCAITFFCSLFDWFSAMRLIPKSPLEAWTRISSGDKLSKTHHNLYAWQLEGGWCDLKWWRSWRWSKWGGVGVSNWRGLSCAQRNCYHGILKGNMKWLGLQQAVWWCSEWQSFISL